MGVGVNRESLERLLEELQGGGLSLEEAATSILDEADGTSSGSPDDPLDYVTLDLERAERVGVPEVIFGEGKSGEQIAAIMRSLGEASQEAIATRVSPEKAAVALQALPGVVWHETARILHLPAGPWRELGRGEVLVVCAGTSDLPVAEEAACVAHLLGNRVKRIADVGVAGIHRLLRHREALREARVLIVVAGMEGALPSVVAGLTDKPVIAVPTSVGYGTAFGGVTALLAMLNSCATGVSVVNIDNGFGAAYQASLINRLP